jgi:hypothetical protein
MCGHKVSVQARRKSISIGSHKSLSDVNKEEKTTNVNPTNNSNPVNISPNVSNVNVSGVHITPKTTTVLTLENEFRQILELSIVGIIIEKVTNILSFSHSLSKESNLLFLICFELRLKVNLSQRYLICTAKRGKYLVQVKITFPTLYPHMAPPAFELLSNISPQSKAKIKEVRFLFHNSHSFSFSFSFSLSSFYSSSSYFVICFEEEFKRSFDLFVYDCCDML